MGFALAAGCAQPPGDVLMQLAASFADTITTDEMLETEGDADSVDASSAAALFVGHAGFELVEARRWVRHRVRPRERLTAIAARYGVDVEDLARYNSIDPNVALAKRRHVRVFTDRLVPDLRRVSYTVGPDETWDDVAAALRIAEQDLRVQNFKTRKPAPGDVLTAWIDPLEGPSFSPPDEPTAAAPLELHDEGKSVGLPQRGKLLEGVQLPEHPLWVRGHPDHLWASAHALRVIHRAFEVLRGELGYTTSLLIGSISRRKGGKMPPHRSHQSGRDIDIRLPLRPGLGKTKAPSADQIDWYATWSMIEAFVRTGETEVVFLNEAHHGRLYEAARAMGVPRSRVHEIVRWPAWRGGSDPVVQHADGHNAHLHVRVRCGSDEAKCESDP